MNANTQSFPENVSDYWHLPLPAAYDFMTSNRTPKKIKRLCIQTLLNRAEHLIDLKPNDGEYIVSWSQSICLDYGIHKSLCLKGILM
nr:MULTISPECIES: DUF3916 domain-containing protein [Bacillus]